MWLGPILAPDFVNYLSNCPTGSKDLANQMYLH